MKTLIGTAALVLSVISLGASPVAFAGDADFTLINRTGYEIREVYVSAANKNSWGRDRLGDGTLQQGKSRLFKFSDKAACEQDIKVVFEVDASEVIWEDINLCEVNKVTLKYDKRSNTVSADLD